MHEGGTVIDAASGQLGDSVLLRAVIMAAWRSFWQVLLVLDNPCVPPAVPTPLTVNPGKPTTMHASHSVLFSSVLSVLSKPGTKLTWVPVKTSDSLRLLSVVPASKISATMLMDTFQTASREPIILGSKIKLPRWR